MDGRYLIAVLIALIAILAAMAGGYARALPSPAPERPPVATPAIADCHPAFGQVYYNGTMVPGAKVTGAIPDDTYRASNVSNSSGAYFLLMPPGARFNITAAAPGMQRTIWPALPGYQYDVNLTAVPGSYIMGTGIARGGPMGFNASLYNLSGTQIIAEPAVAGHAIITARAGSDGRYLLEVEPGIPYHVRGALAPSTWLHYHGTSSGGPVMDIAAGKNETALLDYIIVLPA